MKIKNAMLSAMALYAATLSAPTSAAVLYEWSGESTIVFDDTVRFEASFSFENDEPIGNFQVLDLSKVTCVLKLNGINVGCLEVRMGEVTTFANGNVVEVVSNSFGRAGSSYSMGSVFSLDSLSMTGSYDAISFNPSRLTVTNTNSAPAVPEPATWAMFILGLGLVGGAMRQRKALTATLSSA
ncbi:PEPxxWA-CTERM sorting domain-containing protein [Erythrobacter sp. sf7]|uniref:PEPxxWA-CTERM sorting domain-containing protein n=1 Tax=Erythrobacter fulvus TaxID=2987523 RepID=A0ABT5JP03_9SPHN|nr:PEPxxWA-CTERM sorting domain-containing protein [Erythrobacter fulvus]MDC8753327.1 PEPxxWA-CTERM sorting domain-containing protein [Erythrobacter fulvus]